MQISLVQIFRRATTKHQIFTFTASMEAFMKYVLVAIIISGAPQPYPQNRDTYTRDLRSFNTMQECLTHKKYIEAIKQSSNYICEVRK